MILLNLMPIFIWIAYNIFWFIRHGAQEMIDIYLFKYGWVGGLVFNGYLLLNVFLVIYNFKH